MTRPDFLVIGAYKAGTTSLDRHLRTHPEIFLPAVKEPSYYAFTGPNAASRPRPPDAVTDRREYLALFDAVAGERAIGEVSGEYLAHPDAADAIAADLPDVKLIAVLRNPVERAYSDYLMYVRDGREPLDFTAALAAQDERARAGDPRGHYVDTGRYGEQLERYYQRFDRSQIRVYLFEDLVNDPASCIRDVFTFLGVDPTFVPRDLGENNVSGVPRGRVQAALLRMRAQLGPSLKRVVPPSLRTQIDRRLQSGLARPPMPAAARAELNDLYRADNERLGRLVGLDLRSWLAPA